jgi:hypothetical protein
VDAGFGEEDEDSDEQDTNAMMRKKLLIQNKESFGGAEENDHDNLSDIDRKSHGNLSDLSGISAGDQHKMEEP